MPESLSKLVNLMPLVVKSSELTEQEGSCAFAYLKLEKEEQPTYIDVVFAEADIPSGLPKAKIGKIMQRDSLFKRVRRQVDAYVDQGWTLTVVNGVFVKTSKDNPGFLVCAETSEKPGPMKKILKAHPHAAVKGRVNKLSIVKWSMLKKLLVGEELSEEENAALYADLDEEDKKLLAAAIEEMKAYFKDDLESLATLDQRMQETDAPPLLDEAGPIARDAVEALNKLIGLPEDSTGKTRLEQLVVAASAVNGHVRAAAGRRLKLSETLAGLDPENPPKGLDAGHVAQLKEIADGLEDEFDTLVTIPWRAALAGLSKLKGMDDKGAMISVLGFVRLELEGLKAGFADNADKIAAFDENDFASGTQVGIGTVQSEIESMLLLLKDAVEELENPTPTTDE